MIHTILKPQFAYDALEPYFDQATMEIHTEKHHQTYADKLNAALADHPELQDTYLPELVTSAIPAVKNFAGGVWNHNFFWSIITPDKDQSVPNRYKSFIPEFTEAATKLFGSGWTWLVKTPGALEGSDIEVINLPNQDSPLSLGKIPLLALDVWEHAYYLKYQNRRPEYIENFWHIVNWQQVDNIYINL